MLSTTENKFRFRLHSESHFCYYLHHHVPILQGPVRRGYGYSIGALRFELSVMVLVSSYYSCRMLSRSLRFSNHQRRTFVSSLFGFTFFATVLTVSASTMLPCPVRANKMRFADGVDEKQHTNRGRVTVVEKKPKRWIEETKSWLLLLSQSTPLFHSCESIEFGHIRTFIRIGDTAWGSGSNTVRYSW